VVQRYGHGKTASLLIGDAWRWPLQSEEGRDDWAKAWRQLMRWLVVDSPQKVELTVEQPTAESGSRPLLRALVRDDRFEPLDDAGVVFELLTPEEIEGRASTNRSVRISAEQDSGEPGVYTAAFLPRNQEVLGIRASVSNRAGVLLGQPVTAWVNDKANREFEALGFNRDLLDGLARQSGGELIPAESLDRFADSLPRRQAPTMVPTTRPAWHRVETLVLGLLCFVMEWGLRRWKGFA